MGGVADQTSHKVIGGRVIAVLILALRCPRCAPCGDDVRDLPYRAAATATAGADSTGSGAVQIKFVTRQGTNKFLGSAYLYMRDPRWNSNYWFNNRDLAPDPDAP